MKLTIELVPRTCWYSNLRSRLKKSDWDIIRRKCYKDHNYLCGICGIDNVRLNCHEIWFYDVDKKIQFLKGFIALCNSCHMIKHMGHTNIIARSNKIDKENIIKHFMKVNNCSRAVYEKHYKEAFRDFYLKSQINWKTDLGFWSDYFQKQSKLLKFKNSK